MKYKIINFSDIAKHPNFSLSPSDYIDLEEDEKNEKVSNHGRNEKADCGKTEG